MNKVLRTLRGAIFGLIGFLSGVSFGILLSFAERGRAIRVRDAAGPLKALPT